jgi:hypothetical protein
MSDGQDWKKDPAIVRRAVAKYRKDPANREKLVAKQEVCNAIRKGDIKKPSKCSRCGRSRVHILAHQYTGHGTSSVYKIKRVYSAYHRAIDTKHSASKTNIRVKRALAVKKKS